MLVLLFSCSKNKFGGFVYEGYNCASLRTNIPYNK